METLPHVRCHCMSKNPMYTARHNNIVARLRTACRNLCTTTHKDQLVGSTNLRPDLVARSEEAIILDIYCPFITDPTPSPKPPLPNITKFKPVRLYLAHQYQRVIVNAVIIGVCSWDPKNDAIMQRICTLSSSIP